VPTQEKVETVEEFRTRLDGVTTVLLTEYRGLTVQQLADLRKQLRAVSAEYKVIKNRLARIAIVTSKLEALNGHLKGPTGLVISKQDPVAVAKTLHTFARTNQALAIKAGYVEGQVLLATELRALADLPSREMLRSQIVGVVQGPLAQLVGLLTAAQRELAFILSERGKKADVSTDGAASVQAS
jgi:large subunit ribosomal protein L10